MSKLGRLRLSLHRPIHGLIKTLTLCRDALGHWYASFSIEVRIHHCPHCGLTVDRDLNAARNILARGLARLGASAP